MAVRINGAGARADMHRTLYAEQVSTLARNATSAALAAGQAALQDGAWHMLTLTTLYDGTPGFAMAVDGALVAELSGNRTYTGARRSLFGCLTWTVRGRLQAAIASGQPCRGSASAAACML